MIKALASSSAFFVFFSLRVKLSPSICGSGETAKITDANIDVCFQFRKALPIIKAKRVLRQIRFLFAECFSVNKAVIPRKFHSFAENLRICICIKEKTGGTSITTKSP